MDFIPSGLFQLVRSTLNKINEVKHNKLRCKMLAERCSTIAVYVREADIKNRYKEEVENFVETLQDAEYVVSKVMKRNIFMKILKYDKPKIDMAFEKVNNCVQNLILKNILFETNSQNMSTNIVNMSKVFVILVNMPKNFDHEIAFHDAAMKYLNSVYPKVKRWVIKTKVQHELIQSLDKSKVKTILKKIETHFEESAKTIQEIIKENNEYVNYLENIINGHIKLTDICENISDVAREVSHNFAQESKSDILKTLGSTAGMAGSWGLIEAATATVPTGFLGLGSAPLLGAVAPYVLVAAAVGYLGFSFYTGYNLAGSVGNKVNQHHATKISEMADNMRNTLKNSLLYKHSKEMNSWLNDTSLILINLSTNIEFVKEVIDLFEEDQDDCLNEICMQISKYSSKIVKSCDKFIKHTNILEKTS